MSKALELAKFGRETIPTGAVVGDSDTQTLSNKTFSTNPVISSGTANGVAYLNGSKALTTGTALVFDGTNLGIGTGTNSIVSRLNISDGAAMYGAGTGEMIQLRRTPANGSDSTSFVGITLGNGSNSFKIGYGGTTDRFRFIDGGAIEVLSLLNGGNVGIGTTSASASYGRLTVAGTGISITPDTSAKFQIGRYSAGAPYSYIKMGTTSSGLRITDPTDSVDLITIDSNGNLGLGVTPSAWKGDFKAIQIGSGAAFWAPTATSIPYAYMSSNSYYDATGTNRYIQTSHASWYIQQAGTHIWSIAPSGTAGAAISFTQAMTLTNAGNLGIGTTSPTHKLEIYGGDNTNSFRLYGNSTAGPSIKIEYTGASGRAWNIISNSDANAGGAGALQIWNSTDAVTAMVIAPRGDVGIGSTSPYNSAWGADSHQLAIGGTRGYGVVHLNNTARNFSMGAGAGYHYMSYDNVAQAHNLIINQYGVVALRGGAYSTATGVGIAFPPTQVASNDVNTLDDYEEGEINGNNLGLAYATPGTSSFTYSDRRGTYTKIGRVVYFTTDIRLASFSKGTASGTLSVIGLPFTQRTTAGYDNARCTVQLYNWTYTTSPIIASVASAGTNIMITRMVSGGITVDIDDPSGGSIIWVTGFYFV